MGTHNDVPSPWGQEITRWCSTLIARAQSPHTVSLRRYHLSRLARDTATLSPWDVTGDVLAEWLASQTWGRETRRSYAATLRRFWAWAIETGRTTHDPTSVIGRIKPQPPAPHPAPDEAYFAALAAARLRDRLMLRLAAELGMRRGEVCRVHATDVVGRVGRRSLIVHGKGGKERTVPIGEGLALAVLDQAAGGWCFPGRGGGHLSAAHVGRIVSRLLPEGVSMHALRHRWGTTAYGRTLDLLAVQSVLGHASPDTTLRYVLVPDDALRAAVAAVG